MLAPLLILSVSLVAAGPDPDQPLCRQVEPSGTRLGGTQLCLPRRDWAVLDAEAARGNMMSVSSIAPSRPAPEAPPLALSERPAAGTGETIAGALAQLRARPELSFTVQDGWTVATDAAAGASWAFAPPANGTHPVMVRRDASRSGNAVSTNYSVRCEAERETCRALIRAYAAREGVMLAEP